MNPISIRKVLNFTKGSIEVRFNGIPSANANLDKIDKLLEDFINNHRHNYMIENVSIVRTILKNCEEKLLVIFYKMKKVQNLLNMIILICSYTKKIKEKKIVNIMIDIKLNTNQLMV